MTWDELRVQWNELSEHARRHWTRLTGILQLHYGAHRRTIEREVRAFTRSFCAPQRSAGSPIAADEGVGRTVVGERGRGAF